MSPDECPDVSSQRDRFDSERAEERKRVTLDVLRGMLASGQRSPPANMVAAAVEYADEVLRFFGA
jgi:hypothetical protein